LTVGDAVPIDSPLRQLLPAAGFGGPGGRAHPVGARRPAGVVVLVLDDFHHVTDPGVLESFGHLLEHQPAAAGLGTGL
jgi:hypothetical protein